MCVEYFSDHTRGIVYTVFYYVILYLFPVITMFVTYGTIASKLWHRQIIGETPPDSQRDSMKRLKASIKHTLFAMNTCNPICQEYAGFFCNLSMFYVFKKVYRNRT
jgi:hypothetical protein